MTSLQLIRWLWRDYLRPWRWWFALAMLLMSVEGATVGALSFLVKPMFDQVFVGGSSEAVVWVALAVGGVFVLRALTGFAHKVIMARLGERMVQAMQGDVLRHLLTLDQSFYTIHPPGSLIERTRGDSGAIRNLASQVIAALGRDLSALISVLAVVLWIDPMWTLVAVAGVPLLLLPIIALQKLVRRTSRKARAAAADNATRLDEIYHGVATIQINGIEAREADRYTAAQRRYIKQQVRAETGSAAIPALIDLVAAIGLAGVLTYGGYEIIGGEKTVGEFMTFFIAMAAVFDPLRRLGAISGAWQSTRASLDRVVQLLQIAPRVTSPAKPLPTPTERGAMRLEFESVSFGYGTSPVLANLGFTAEPGQTTAIVGPSGAGKTTLFKLLTRMIDPDTGRVTVAGQDLRDLDLAQLRGLYSVVAQDTALFDETIRDNILLGRKDVTEAQLAAALDSAHLTEFVAGLPAGLDTPAGPRGSALSGGQRQRVAIARALLRDAPILLLDEATSALDAKSERMVQDALERLAQGRTTLVIAHRLATVRNADKIVVMQAGHVVEQGRHDELVAQNGVYASLSRLQFGA
ncbi:ATP-binding cassette domain-containing protein [Frigidibacter albus]|uniref:ATP-binding cassette domain-containing protein n=1 Tax=Frigidibacter albus TaxID=1465486 RepID=A0A6L8VIY6_9RHOB|nr:ABC transporter ATP-binding protein [Frigidibacter albus]MZQ90347.1 ATP-binding cassette domain-containing protein [Frigidibacter albus]NBE32155.1 ATP-binding cassette domain-containing protein [Frigidibacter albus]GGH58894.1 ABC transporter permease [Frigidibacter albus]